MVGRRIACTACPRHSGTPVSRNYEITKLQAVVALVVARVRVVVEVIRFNHVRVLHRDVICTWLVLHDEYTHTHTHTQTCMCTFSTLSLHIIHTHKKAHQITTRVRKALQRTWSTPTSPASSLLRCWRDASIDASIPTQTNGHARRNLSRRKNSMRMNQLEVVCRSQCCEQQCHVSVGSSALPSDGRTHRHINTTATNNTRCTGTVACLCLILSRPPCRTTCQLLQSTPECGSSAWWSRWGPGSPACEASL